MLFFILILPSSLFTDSIPQHLCVQSRVFLIPMIQHYLTKSLLYIHMLPFSPPHYIVQYCCTLVTQ